jgi:uncharacterized membrane protein YozB (DUF420 family)
LLSFETASGAVFGVYKLEVVCGTGPDVPLASPEFCERRFGVLTGPIVILTLKIAVLAVTLLFLASLVALWRGNYRLHGRINLIFFILTASAVLGLEVIIRLISTDLFDYFDAEQKLFLNIHLCFSVPSAVIMPVMLFTGLTHRRSVHLRLAVVFSILWTGTFITGVFFLPHVP